MTEAIVVRPLREADRPAWERLWAGYNAFYERAIDEQTTDLTWSRFFDDREPVHALVAERDGVVVGLVHYLFHRSTSLIPLSCYLQDLFTAGDVRRQGIGGSLIEAVYERARAAGSPQVYWQTQETNHTARRLYDRLAERSGFIVYRRRL